MPATTQSFVRVSGKSKESVLFFRGELLGSQALARKSLNLAIISHFYLMLLRQYFSLSIQNALMVKRNH